MPRDWGLEWRLVAPKGKESCRWQSVDFAWVALSLGHQGDITKIVVTASDGRMQVVGGYEEALDLARSWRAGWSARLPSREADNGNGNGGSAASTQSEPPRRLSTPPLSRPAPRVTPPLARPSGKFAPVPAPPTPELLEPVESVRLSVAREFGLTGMTSQRRTVTSAGLMGAVRQRPDDSPRRVLPDAFSAETQTQEEEDPRETKDMIPRLRR